MISAFLAVVDVLIGIVFFACAFRYAKCIFMQLPFPKTVPKPSLFHRVTFWFSWTVMMGGVAILSWLVDFYATAISFFIFTMLVAKCGVMIKRRGLDDDFVKQYIYSRKHLQRINDSK